MNLSQFVTWAINQGSVAKYNDGLYKGECVSLINQYCYRVLNVPAGAWGHAYAWASSTNGPVRTYFDQLDRTTTLQPGDILVYPANVSNMFYGHIEIYVGNGWSLGQNRGLDYKVRQQSTLNGYICVLRKKGGMTVGTIPNTDNYYQRYGIDLAQRVRGRALSREEFRIHIAGKTDLGAVETLSDNVEANNWLATGRLGRIAANDKWQQQIYDLQDANKNATKERNQARDEAAKFKADSETKALEITTLKSQLAIQSDDTKNLNALGLALQWAIKRLGLKG